MAHCPRHSPTQDSGFGMDVSCSSPWPMAATSGLRPLAVGKSGLLVSVPTPCRPGPGASLSPADRQPEPHTPRSLCAWFPHLSGTVPAFRNFGEGMKAQ